MSHGPFPAPCSLRKERSPASSRERREKSVRACSAESGRARKGVQAPALSREAQTERVARILHRFGRNRRGESSFRGEHASARRGALKSPHNLLVCSTPRGMREEKQSGADALRNGSWVGPRSLVAAFSRPDTGLLEAAVESRLVQGVVEGLSAEISLDGHRCGTFFRIVF